MKLERTHVRCYILAEVSNGIQSLSPALQAVLQLHGNAAIKLLYKDYFQAHFPNNQRTVYE